MAKPWNRSRFDIVELLFTSFFVGLCVWLFAQTTDRASGFRDQTTLDELRRLKTAYGPSHYSQFQEEWIIRDFFKDRREGVFVDVGANHYRNDSTTFYLEEKLGWSGIALIRSQDSKKTIAGTGPEHVSSLFLYPTCPTKRPGST